MRETKLYIAAGIFLALTCIKLLMPQAVDGMRSEIVRQIDRSIDYEAVVLTLAQKVEDYSLYFAEETPVPTAHPTPVPTAKPSPVPTTQPTPEPTPEPTPTPEPDGLTFEHTWPLAAIEVSSGFGSRMHPIEGEERFHYGLDISASHGDDIFAFAGGEVITAEYSDSYGNYIVIRHDDTYSSLYAHCSKLLVSRGDAVSAGQKIALVGQTGLATGPHLHFELRENDVCIDPAEFLC